MAVPETVRNLLGENVVVDTDTHLIYLGILKEVGDDYLLLGEVDVHSQYDSHSSREIYLMDAGKYGIRQNRKGTVVLLSRVVGVSRLDDITKY
ncbi:MAG: hypothetical protein JW909_14040 [Planctomycetes bacterium]|nr:hypothetical protein [Planctomycetota bacterium]